MIGERVAHYQIIDKLGEGGMGVVYRARDTHLDRFVAIKVLPAGKVADPERKRRFVQEAKAASALNHPNIVTVHDISEADGMTFIAMECVEGKILHHLVGRKGLKLKDVLRYAVQIAGALAKAHAAGIVHRDLKPANIMVTRDGVVKLLDFGLAKLTEREADEFATTETLQPQTEEGTIIGTAAFMSPEQVEGKKVDARSDIFSFGSVLYEMTTGKRAFQGESKLATLSAILYQEPAPVRNVPTELEKLITRCLQKDPERRAQHMADVKVALEELKEESEAGYADRVVDTTSRRQSFFAAVMAALLVVAGLAYWFGVSRSARIDSLAVLPFVNASGDPNTEYLSEGISESLITSLSRVPRVKVKSWDTVFRYQKRDNDIQVVGRELGVRGVLKGRLVQHGDSLSISAELVDTRDGTLLWRDQYDKRVADILAIQQEISKEISEQLRLRLTGEEQRRLAKSSTLNPEAFQSYLQGRHYWSRRTEESQRKGIEYFQQAIERDPQYALAWAGLADSLLLLGIYSWMPAAEAYPRAKAAAARAIEMEQTLAEAHASLAHVSAMYEWNWPAADREFQRAIKLNSEYGTAHHWRGYYLVALGRLPEALAEMRRAQEVEPLSLMFNGNGGMFYYYARQYEQAAHEALRAMEMDPAFHRPHLVLGLAYALQRRPNEASRELERALDLSHRGFHELALSGSAFAFMGRREEARRLLQEMIDLSRKRYIAPYLPAMIHANLGETDRAFELYEKALQERSLLPNFLRDPLLDGIRSDPRFQTILQRMGLSPSSDKPSTTPGSKRNDRSRMPG